MSISFNPTFSQNIESTTSSISWGIGTGNFTVSLWVRPSGFPSTFAGAVSFTDGTNNDVSPGIFTSSSATPNTWRASLGGTLTFNSTLSSGVWTHLVLRRTSTGTDGVQGFFNGAEEANKYTSADAFLDKSWVIGSGRVGGSLPMDGRVAEVGVWSSDLSNNQINALSKGARPLDIGRGTLVGYISLIRKTYVDRIQNIKFSESGSPSVADHVRVIIPVPDWGSRRSFVHPPFTDGVSNLGVSIPASTRTQAIGEALASLGAGSPAQTVSQAILETLSSLGLSLPALGLEQTYQEALASLAVSLQGAGTAQAATDMLASLGVEIYGETTQEEFLETLASLGVSLPAQGEAQSFADTADSLGVSLPAETRAQSFADTASSLGVGHPAPTFNGQFGFLDETTGVAFSLPAVSLSQDTQAALGSLGVSLPAGTETQAFADAVTPIGIGHPEPQFNGQFGFLDETAGVVFSLPAPSALLAYEEQVASVSASLPQQGSEQAFLDLASSIALALFGEDASVSFQEPVFSLGVEVYDPQAPGGPSLEFLDEVLAVGFSLPAFVVSSDTLAFLSQKQRIQHRLLDEVLAGPFYAYRIDPNTKRVTIRMAVGQEIKPARTFVDETNSEAGIARSNRTEFRRERLSWTWEVELLFAEPATVEFFERRLAAQPPFLPPDSQNDLEWVRLNWLDSRYEHPPQQQSSNGTRATLTFEAVLGPS